MSFALLFASAAFAMGKHPEKSDERILLIGDSHTVGSFGRKLDSLLRERAANVATFASCGTSPGAWVDGAGTKCGYWQKDFRGHVQSGLEAPTPILKMLVRQLKPTMVVVALGANLVNAPRDWADATTREMISLFEPGGEAAGVRCVWVGPPHGRNKPEPGFSEFYTWLEPAVVPPCESFIDSRPFAHYPDTGGDGVHYDHLGPAGVAIAQHWAQEVFNLIPR